MVILSSSRHSRLSDQHTYHNQYLQSRTGIASEPQHLLGHDHDVAGWCHGVEGARKVVDGHWNAREAAICTRFSRAHTQDGVETSDAGACALYKTRRSRAGPYIHSNLDLNSHPTSVRLASSSTASATEGRTSIPSLTGVLKERHLSMGVVETMTRCSVSTLVRASMRPTVLSLSSDVTLTRPVTGLDP